jgi:hypothetical protein
MQQSITLPYLRTSPVHVPRRDLVLSASDSLLLNVAVVERDHPSSSALILTTDACGPSMQLVLWNESDRWNTCCDYERPGTVYGTVLRSVTGHPGDAVGSWDFHIPTGTFANFPRRCGWTILLLWNDGTSSSVLAQGIVSFLRPFVQGVPLSAIPPDPDIPPVQPGAGSLLDLVTSDTLRPMLASVTLDQLETS